ncbi:UDP-N,N'-diacetylbacillosamine 2-epimerase (hydrolyzing) [hydrothermal vent metagenome]|uniref:UDP-N,N'-diacetylbacillosamine 2-epimerase (Hydrolyzing) n=1 Tax=hydrothermal vent metagenome TaxID=652676 RepID=A0A3B0XN87_9ZZZZ
MVRKRKICVVTGSRAEYGLLYWLIKEIDSDAALELQLVVTGMHLSPEYGLTYKEIEKDFKIDKKIEILLSSDTPVGVSKAMGLAQISFAETYNDIKPDIVVILGDRYEIFSAVSAAMISRIPIAHLSGGELTLGAIDDSIRHSITKMSHLHFVSTEEYRRRVIQLGESPDRVFNFGEAGLDNIYKLNLLSREEFEKSIDWELNKKNFLFTYHPTTLDDIDTIKFDIKNILDFFSTLVDTSIILTKANADCGGKVINSILDEYSKKHKNTRLFTSLGQLRYLSALQYVDAVIGNTSSGLVEAPGFKTAAINVGDRQKGRVKPESVIDCRANKNDLDMAIKKLYSEDFQKDLKNTINPYGEGGASIKTKDVLKNIDLSGLIYKYFVDSE